MLNRQTRRELAHCGKLEEFMNDVYQKEHEKTRAHAYTHAWVSMFLALCDRWPQVMTADMLHSIAVDTLEYTNGIEPASELAVILRERTGFDIDERPQESILNYIEKGEHTMDYTELVERLRDWADVEDYGTAKATLVEAADAIEALDKRRQPEYPFEE